MISSARFTFHDLAPGEESFRDAVLKSKHEATLESAIEAFG